MKYSTKIIAITCLGLLAAPVFADPELLTVPQPTSPIITTVQQPAATATQNQDQAKASQPIVCPEIVVCQTDNLQNCTWDHHYFGSFQEMTFDKDVDPNLWRANNYVYKFSQAVYSVDSRQRAHGQCIYKMDNYNQSLVLKRDDDTMKLDFVGSAYWHSENAIHNSCEKSAKECEFPYEQEIVAMDDA